MNSQTREPRQPADFKLQLVLDMHDGRNVTLHVYLPEIHACGVSSNSECSAIRYARGVQLHVASARLDRFP